MPKASRHSSGRSGRVRALLASPVKQESGGKVEILASRGLDTISGERSRSERQSGYRHHAGDRQQKLKEPAAEQRLANAQTFRRQEASLDIHQGRACGG